MGEEHLRKNTGSSVLSKMDNFEMPPKPAGRGVGQAVPSLSVCRPGHLGPARGRAAVPGLRAGEGRTGAGRHRGEF